ncbi:hypothetical protein [Bacillus cereus group sp. BfR-BA-01381]|uniref:hypothetical protein n=1 Tax=Bacillus cereus group sp. BfR-BA-01381 TaxID=2920325 RepID=UPI001F59D698|nr:hypothetical protein [Bacillus cereus group sp. BfR-BA-01381]
MKYFTHTNEKLNKFQNFWHQNCFKEAINTLIDCFPLINATNISIDNPILPISPYHTAYSKERYDFSNKVSLMLKYNKDIDSLSEEEIANSDNRIGNEFFYLLNDIKEYKNKLNKLDYAAAGQSLITIQDHSSQFSVNFRYYLFSWIIEQSQKNFIYPHRKKFMPDVLKFFIRSLNPKRHSDSQEFIQKNKFILDELTPLLLRYFDVRKPNQKQAQSGLIRILTDTVYELKMVDKLLPLMRNFDNPYNTNPIKIIEIAYNAENEYSLYFCIDRLREFLRRYRYEPVWKDIFNEAKAFLVEILKWIANSLNTKAYKEVSFGYLFQHINQKLSKEEVISELEKEFSKKKAKFEEIIKQNSSDKIYQFKHHEVLELLSLLSSLKTDIARMPFGKEFREELLDQEEKCIMYRDLPQEIYLDSLELEIEKLKSKVTSLEIKKVREKFIDRIENLDKDSEEFEIELKELLEEIDCIVESKIKDLKYENVREVEKELKLKFDKVISIYGDCWMIIQKIN